MDNDKLAKQIIELQNDLIQIKISQNSQNDSFKFYTYRSSNLYTSNSDGVKYAFKFTPIQNSENAIIRWYACDLSAIQFINFPGIKVDDPFRATISVFPLSENFFPASLKHVYLSCMSNVEGIITYQEVPL